jgi:predicted Rossmann fold flavoprotein
METQINPQVCIIGAGPAGLMSAIFAAQAGAKAIIIEKNPEAGKKLLLTGGGRCNLTHTGSIEDFVKIYGLPPRLPTQVGAAGKAGRFLRHSLYELSPDETREFFTQLGLATKVDEEGCVFPVSERAGDVLDVLMQRCRELDVQFLFGPPSALPMARPRPARQVNLADEAGPPVGPLRPRSEANETSLKAGRGVEKIEKQGEGFAVFTGKEIISAKKVIIATGGLSFPQTGSTGDGYKLAKSLGHTIIEPRAALVPLLTEEKWTLDLAGTSLEIVKISATVEGKKIVVTGPMIFTHDGIGGPAVLDLSRLLADYLSAIGSADGETSPAAVRRAGPAQKPIQILIDIVPSMNEEKLEQYLLDQLSQYSRKIIVNVLFDLIPKKLAGFLCRWALIAETKGYQFKKEQRRQIIRLLKKLPLSITAARPIEEAVITRGGVSRTEIDSKTMQSKICPGLFFAGEILDADGPCGGYNLQICWSTGALAGKI